MRTFEDALLSYIARRVHFRHLVVRPIIVQRKHAARWKALYPNKSLVCRFQAKEKPLFNSVCALLSGDPCSLDPSFGWLLCLGLCL